MVTLTGNTIISFRKGVAEVSRARIAGSRIFGARLAGIGGAYIAGTHVAGGAEVYVIGGAGTYIARARLLGVAVARFTSRPIYVFFIFYLLKISLEILSSLLYTVS